MGRSLQTLLILGSATSLVGSLSAETFTTVAPGNWTDAATWSGGVAPTTDVDGDDIVIGHDVTVVNSNIKLIGGATFTASDAGFTMLNGNFVVENGTADFAGCQVLIEHGFSIQITTASGSLTMVGCDVDVGQNFQNSEGLRYLEDICLVVDENFQNAKGSDTLINICALIGNSTSGNFQNDSDSQMHIEASEFHLPNGDFQNQSSATLTGNIDAIWLENGNLQNSGAWSAPVASYCVSGQVTVSSAFLPPAEDCVGTPALFDSCDCMGPTTTCVASLGDFVWNDLDGDGIQTAGEPGVGGVTIILQDGQGGFLDSTLTDASGFYQFSGSCEGDYKVVLDTQTLPPGFVLSPCGQGIDPTVDSNCSPADVNLSAGEYNDSIDFGLTPIPFINCPSLPNSTGQTATGSANGSTSITTNDLSVTFVNLPPGQPAMLFYGTNGANVPFGSGIQCIGSPIVRYHKIPDIDANGTAVFSLDFASPPMDAGFGQVVPGVPYYFQLWFRDPPTFNMSDSLCITFAP